MRILCSKCKRLTDHDIISEYREEFRPEDDPEMQVDFADGTWQILRCGGCRTVSFRESWITSEDYDPQEGAFEPTETLYPHRTADSIAPRLLLSVPKRIRHLYQQAVEAYNIDLRGLCAAGLRALLEAICADQGVKTGHVTKGGRKKRIRTLEGKIEGLHEKGILTQRHARVLHQHRYLGNQALHEFDDPPTRELQLAIEILELTLRNLYELPDMGEDLRQSKNQRRSGGSESARQRDRSKANDAS